LNRIIAVIAGSLGLLYLLPSVLGGLLPYLPAFLGVPLFHILPRVGSPLQAVASMALGIVLLLFARRRWLTKADSKAGYRKESEGAFTRFIVTPAPPPISWPVALFALIFAFGTVNSGIAIMSFFFTAAAAALLLLDQRGKAASQSRSFRLSNEGIEIDGDQLRREDIHHLAIRNKFGGNFEIVYDANRGIPTGEVLGLAARRKLAAVAYRVEVESGGRVRLVAAGLDDVTARALTTEIGRTLDLRA
jgi:hypothetical protein